MSDADAKTYFEQRKDSYGKPERRDVRQIVFPNAQEAAAARERIAKGASFDDIAKERGLKASDTDLGMVAKADIIDPAVGRRRLRAQIAAKSAHRSTAGSAA